MVIVALTVIAPKAALSARLLAPEVVALTAIGALTLIALMALIESVLLLAHEIGALMMMSPGPLVRMPGPMAPSVLVCSVTLVVARFFVIVAAALSSTVRSVGSTSQVPVLPAFADVSTVTL